MADVTIVDVDATYVNPPTVEYDAGELRRADQAMFVTGGIARTSPTSLAVSVDGSDVVTVKAGSWVIPGNAVAGSGVWRGGIASDVTANLAARDATYGRIDLVVARQLDTDVVGTHGAYTGRIEILTGDPSATPGVKDLPDMAVELGRITVPKDGGGAASVDLAHRRFAAALGGVIDVPAASAMPAAAPTGQRAKSLDTWVGYTWSGTVWVPDVNARVAASANLDVSGTNRLDVPGLSYTFQSPGTAAVWWVDVSLDANDANLSTGTLIAELLVDGASDAAQMVFSPNAKGIRVPMQKVYLVTGLAPGSHTVKVTARQSGTGAAIRINLTHSVMSVRSA